MWAWKLISITENALFLIDITQVTLQDIKKTLSIFIYWISLHAISSMQCSHFWTCWNICLVFILSPSLSLKPFYLLNSFSIIFLHMPPLFSLIKHVLQTFCSPFSSINILFFCIYPFVICWWVRRELLYAMLVLSHIGKDDREEKEEHGMSDAVPEYQRRIKSFGVKWCL